MKNSIKKSREFKEIYQNDKSFATKNLVMYILKKGDMERNRLGISVSRKVGNSVVRHKIIRRIREIFRGTEEKLEKPFDLVLLCRAGSKYLEFSKLREEFFYLCKKHDILKED